MSRSFWSWIMLTCGVLAMTAAGQEPSRPNGRDPGADYFAEVEPDLELARSSNLSNATDNVSSVAVESYDAAIESNSADAMGAECDAKKMAELKKQVATAH
jgi:hypothetical protein